MQTSSTEIGDTISTDQIRELPGNRDPMNFLNTQPGVQRISGGNRVPTINGQRAAFVNVTLDGVAVCDWRGPQQPGKVAVLQTFPHCDQR